MNFHLPSPFTPDVLARAFAVFLLVPLVSEAADGIVDLGSLGGVSSLGWGVSQDGAVVVGGADTAGNANYRAFRWEVGSSMVDLGSLGGSRSTAFGVSANGAVVVGESDTVGDAAWRAFRWEAGTGMVDLGTLGGSCSTAAGVSADGTVVVGAANTPGDAAYRAFRWEAGTGMVDLGTLGGDHSSAFAVSDNGAVVVGMANTATARFHAFRWQGGAGMSDLGTLGGSRSAAWGVSGDGAVVVGWADMPGDVASHGFRWDAANGMVDLGTLGGESSFATGVSADGRVIVGMALPSGEANFRAFRWTQEAGMQSVEDWLRAAGVTIPVDVTEVAYAANRDGSVVVGVLQNNHAFVARVASAGSGLVTLADVRQSLSDVARGSAAVLERSNLVLQGAHSRPLARRSGEGRNLFWLAGDWGRDDHGARDGNLGLAEFGLGHNFGRVQLNFSVGQTWASQHWQLDGRSKADGAYVQGEALISVGGSLWGVLGAYVHRSDADIRRGYLNAGGQDHSSGSREANTWGVRWRLEWDSAFRLSDALFSPYVDLLHSESRLAAYTEQGGGFPARFDAQTSRLTELRSGINVAKPLAHDVSLLGIVEATHRFDKAGARTSGELLGLFGFDLNGQKNRRDWLRTAVGLGGSLLGGRASLIVNATTRGEGPAWWLAANWQRSF